ncbi:hypothetical protein HQ544_01790 [Candidatus Falkowbacteria bacterium]|nr:hypothetical protein [Candidatus Falkowbacteria bacterium]
MADPSTDTAVNLSIKKGGAALVKTPQGGSEGTTHFLYEGTHYIQGGEEIFGIVQSASDEIIKGIKALEGRVASHEAKNGTPPRGKAMRSLLVLGQCASQEHKISTTKISEAIRDLSVILDGFQEDNTAEENTHLTNLSSLSLGNQRLVKEKNS